MNEIISKFLLTGDKFLPEMHLRQPRFTYSGCGHFPKCKEKKFKETGDSRSIHQNGLAKLSFNMIWLMEILRICLEEQLLIKYYMIKHLVLLKIQNRMLIKEVLLQWFSNFLIKSLLVVLEKKIGRTEN